MCVTVVRFVLASLLVTSMVMSTSESDAELRAVPMLHPFTDVPVETLQEYLIKYLDRPSLNTFGHLSRHYRSLLIEYLTDRYPGSKREMSTFPLTERVLCMALKSFTIYDGLSSMIDEQPDRLRKCKGRMMLLCSDENRLFVVNSDPLMNLSVYGGLMTPNVYSDVDPYGGYQIGECTIM